MLKKIGEVKIELVNHDLLVLGQKILDFLLLGGRFAGRVDVKLEESEENLLVFEQIDCETFELREAGDFVQEKSPVFGHIFAF